jgi:hypothetical protein
MLVDPQVFRWASVRQQLKLERIGLRSSGGALRPRLAKTLGLRPRDSYEVYIAAVTARLEEARVQSS